MNCESARRLFSEYYDGIANAAGVGTHLLECAECAKEYALFCQITDEIRQLPEPATPSDLHAKMMASVRQHIATEARNMAQKRRHAVFMRFVPAAAAVLLMTVFWFSGAFTDNLRDAEYEPFAMHSENEGFEPIDSAIAPSSGELGGRIFLPEDEDDYFSHEPFGEIFFDEDDGQYWGIEVIGEISDEPEDFAFDNEVDRASLTRDFEPESNDSCNRTLWIFGVVGVLVLAIAGLTIYIIRAKK